MESTAFFEKKISLTPKDLNKVGEEAPIDALLEKKLSAMLEEKCSEHGFVLPGTIKLISRSMGYFEAARFTGDAVYYVKAEGRVLYPADGFEVDGKVLRKNKMGLYVKYRDALSIQVPRDLHLGDEDFDSVQIGDTVRIILKKSIFQINDPFILTNGTFVKKVSEGEEQEEAAEEDLTKAVSLAASAAAAAAKSDNVWEDEGKEDEEEEEEEAEEEEEEEEEAEEEEA